MVAIEQRIFELLEAGKVITLTDLGGEDALWAEALRLARSRFLDVLVEGVCSDWESLTQPQRAAELIIQGVGLSDDPIVLADTLDILFTRPEVVALVGKDLSKALLERVNNRTGDLEATIAARALDGALRLAISGIVKRSQVTATLVTIDEEENPLFAANVCRLLSIAYEQWRNPDFVASLQELLTIEDSESDAAFELGMCSLLDGVTDHNSPHQLQSIRDARRWLSRAEASSEERTDAVLIGGILDVILGFSSGADPSFLISECNKLRRVAHLRTQWLSGLRTSWRSVRSDAELQWCCLIERLSVAASQLHRASWKIPSDALVQVVEAYTASRTLRLWSWARDDQSGLHSLIQPPIEAKIIQTAGLRQHVIDWVEELPPELRGAGQHLLQRIESSNSQSGQAVHRHAWPHLEHLVPVPHTDFTAEQVRILDQLENRAAALSTSRVVAASPIVDELYSSLCDHLEACPDFAGEIRSHFEEIMLLTLRFLKSRQDLQRASRSRNMGYLFSWSKRERAPHERALADDYHEFLSSSALSGALHSEVRDIGGGRVDVLIEHGTHRFITEVKRELNDASREFLKRFLGQPASYQDTNVTLGLLLVLDLTPKVRPPHIRSNAWLEVVPPVVPEDQARYIVVVRIPGNRHSPSQLSK